MEVSFLRLSNRELDKKSSENKRKGYQETYYMLSWRRGSLAISQSLALNLHTVLTALVICFVRWQIGNSKLQVGRLLVAGTLIAETTADGKGREAKLCIPAQSYLSCAHGKTITKKNADIFSPIQESLIYDCIGYEQLSVRFPWCLLESWAFFSGISDFRRYI